MLRRKYQEKETANIIAFDMDVRMQKSNGGYFMNNEINRRDFMKLSVAPIKITTTKLKAILREIRIFANFSCIKF